MSTKYIYVSEPDALDMTVISTVLAGSEWVAIAGDSNFTNSQQHPYQALLIRSQTTVGASIREYFPELGHIVRAGVGLDNIDVPFCRAHDIKIYNAPGANAEAVSDYALAMILFALRKLHTKEPEDITAWNRFKFVGHNLGSRTVGIVGFGNIGRLVHKRLQGFGCQEILIYDPYLPEDVTFDKPTRRVVLEELLRQSSVISLHLPLTETTKYLIGRQNIGLLPAGAIVINASRGGIVEEAAVLDALPAQDLVYVADTIEGEPHVNKALLAHENIIITPHIASLTEESEQAVVRVALQNLIDTKTAVIL